MQRGLPTRSAARQRAWLDTEPPHTRAPRRQVDTTRLPQAFVISRTLATSGAGRPATLMLLRGAPRACITMAAALTSAPSASAMTAARVPAGAGGGGGHEAPAPPARAP